MGTPVKNIGRQRLRISGLVQGVGFRPFVYRLALEFKLSGFVFNDPDGVEIEIQGRAESLKLFEQRLRAEIPPQARIDDIKCAAIPINRETGFTILASRQSAGATALIPPDIATCDDCLNELNDHTDRRYLYPFINCTNCGPRYTIVKQLPYDRVSTSMAVFKMCKQCQSEYDDPLDRRFHAQPNCCPDCGPQIWFIDCNSRKILKDPVKAAVKLLKDGGVLAIRGLGGFHLAVEAADSSAVELLRERKGRGRKPFALMSSSLEFIQTVCGVSASEKKLLMAPTRPIVLLRRQSEVSMAAAVAPDQDSLGFMLPYTPLHHLLMREFEALVMTSGNLAEEPIAIGNDEAIERLSGLADGFLLHDREILERCDDSVARVQLGQTRSVRRSRGYVPDPIRVKQSIETTVLAVGGELKNTIAIGRGDNVFLSQHIGDLDNPSAFRFFKESIDHLSSIIQAAPAYIVCDSHPEYLSSKFAHQQEQLPVIEVQHHHAHLASVMAEHGRSERTIGLILDGSGYGTDGTIWGGEILIGDFSSFERFSFFEPVPMPGGESCVREPYRMALSWLKKACPERIEPLKTTLFKAIETARVDAVLELLSKEFNCPITSSCGRLFDAVAFLLGLGDKVSYEAEAAIKLEIMARSGTGSAYPISHKINFGEAINMVPLLRAIIDDIETGRPREGIAASFHATLADYLVATAKAAREYSGVKVVALSGGVWQNELLLKLATDQLAAEGFELITHQLVPTNDGGLALGQVMIANERWAKRKL